VSSVCGSHSGKRATAGRPYQNFILKILSNINLKRSTKQESRASLMPGMQSPHTHITLNRRFAPPLLTLTLLFPSHFTLLLSTSNAAESYIACQIPFRKVDGQLYNYLPTGKSSLPTFFQESRRIQPQPWLIT